MKIISTLTALWAVSCFVLPAFAQAGENVTDEYQNTLSSIRAQESSLDRQRLSGFTIIFVPGIATDLTRVMGEATGNLGITPGTGFLAPFDQQMDWMIESHIDFQMAPINREGSCSANGDVIADTIAGAGHPVILITQSKAGVDALYGMIRHPEIRKKIAGWVAYQPPFAGSPLADIVHEKSEFKIPTDLLLKVLGGTSVSYEDMETGIRQQFNHAHQNEIDEISHEFPIVTLITTEDPSTPTEYLFEDKSKFGFLSPFVGPIQERGGGPNDGIALVAGSCLKYASCIYLHGLDHFAADMDTAPYKTLTRDERIALFRTMLEMLARRAHS